MTLHPHDEKQAAEMRKFHMRLFFNFLTVAVLLSAFIISALFHIFDGDEDAVYWIHVEESCGEDRIVFD